MTMRPTTTRSWLRQLPGWSVRVKLAATSRSSMRGVGTVRRDVKLAPMGTATFLETRRVFSLRDAVAALSPGQRKGTLDRLQYFAKQGRVKSVAYGVYASVPAGVDARRFQPDRYLVAAALRPDGVISHHAALELLGAAHSDWSACTVLTRRRRRPVALDGVTIQFLTPPAMLARRHRENLGVRPVDRLGQTLRVTGPERTLVDGFWQPGLVGGLSELVESAAGFGILDLDLLREVLKACPPSPWLRRTCRPPSPRAPED